MFYICKKTVHIALISHNQLFYIPKTQSRQNFKIRLQLCHCKKGKKKTQQKQFCQMINSCLLSIFNVTQGCKYICLLNSKKNDRKFLTCNKSARLGLTKVQRYQDYQSICNDMLQALQKNKCDVCYCNASHLFIEPMLEHKNIIHGTYSM